MTKSKAEKKGEKRVMLTGYAIMVFETIRKVYLWVYSVLCVFFCDLESQIGWFFSGYIHQNTLRLEFLTAFCCANDVLHKCMLKDQNTSYRIKARVHFPKKLSPFSLKAFFYERKHNFSIAIMALVILAFRR